MPSPRSRSPLLLYGIVLCSFFAPLQVVSSNGQTTQNKGTVAPGNRTCCSKREATSTDEEYLLGIKRQRRLYCNIGIGFHIQVLPTGKITGVHHENRYSEYFSNCSFKQGRKSLQTKYCFILSTYHFHRSAGQKCFELLFTVIHRQ